MIEKSFIHLKERWNGESFLKYRRDYKVDEVCLILKDGDTVAEILVSWYSLGATMLNPAINIDGVDFWALLYLKDVFNYLAVSRYWLITPESFCSMLKSIDYKDVTPREEPK